MMQLRFSILSWITLTVKTTVRALYGVDISQRTHQDVAKKIAKEAQRTVNTLSGFMKTLEIVHKLLLMNDLDLPKSRLAARIVEKDGRVPNEQTQCISNESA